MGLAGVVGAETLSGVTVDWGGDRSNPQGTVEAGFWPERTQKAAWKGCAGTGSWAPPGENQGTGCAEDMGVIMRVTGQAHMHGPLCLQPSACCTVVRFG